MLMPTWDLAPSGLAFLGFVLIVLVLYYLVAPRVQNLVLLVASYAFCAAWNPAFLAVLLASSLLNHLIALRLGESRSRKRLWLWLGLGLNVGGLVVFKYFSQASGYISAALGFVGIHFVPAQLGVLQPIGISFYTLQALSYLLDVSRGQLQPSRTFLETSLYLAYFPKLLAGPIERAGPFFEQLRSPARIDNQRLGRAAAGILVGLVRKLVIADGLMALVPRELFDEPGRYVASELLFWWLVYAFVIYNDFAGYTSIARGVSELFGIQLSPNFDQPFFSTGYMDFWNRWHMSLSRWLRDYIYLPLSRLLLRRNPDGRYLPNLVVPPLVTMLVSGLWHGAAPHFIFWGLINGALQGLERVYKSRLRVTGASPPRWRLLASYALTFVTLVVLSVPFLLEVPETFNYWAALGNWGAPVALGLTRVARPILAIALSLGLDLAQRPAHDESGWLLRRPAVQSAALAAGLLLIFLATRQQAAVPFIYQEF